MERIQAQAHQIKLVALGRLTANMAHEIRNPLAAISHAAELLLERQETATQNRLAHIIGDNTQRLNRLVTDVMELGKRDRAQPEVIRLADAIASLIEDMVIVDPKAQGVIKSSCPESLLLQFDRSHFQRVLTNLLENALRYCSGNAGSVRVEARFQKSRGLVEMNVCDDGTGVSQEDRQHLFEPFFTTRSSGTGLGLYIARELCEANGGMLESMPSEKGAWFRISGKGEQ
jgi:two-component system sensor histidine kinase PilS (NtrC family)